MFQQTAEQHDRHWLSKRESLLAIHGCRQRRTVFRGMRWGSCGGITRWPGTGFRRSRHGASRQSASSAGTGGGVGAFGAGCCAGCALCLPPPVCNPLTEACAGTQYRYAWRWEADELWLPVNMLLCKVDPDQILQRILVMLSICSRLNLSSAYRHNGRSWCAMLPQQEGCTCCAPPRDALCRPPRRPPS